MHTPKIRILIADDHGILRAGLRMLIDTQPDMEVVSEATNGRQALQQVREMTLDVVLLDITMPETNGFQALEQILQASPQIRVLVLSMHDDPAYAHTTLAAGASGYVLKQSADTDLLAAIRMVYRGGTFVDSTLAGPLVQEILEKNAHRGPIATGVRRSLLSPREREVLALLARGHTYQQIAEQLFVSIKSVETYRGRIGQKLGLRSRAELVRYALESGILRPNNPT